MDSCAVWFGFFCFCKQKTAYEMRISDWSSDVCSSDLAAEWRGMREQPFVYVFGRTHFAVSYFGANVFPETVAIGLEQPDIAPHVTGKFVQIGRASCRERVCQYRFDLGCRRSINKKIKHEHNLVFLVVS